MCIKVKRKPKIRFFSEYEQGDGQNRKTKQIPVSVQMAIDISFQEKKLFKKYSDSTSQNANMSSLTTEVHAHPCSTPYIHRDA